MEQSGHSVMAARVLWEDLVPVQIWVPRQIYIKLRLGRLGSIPSGPTEPNEVYKAVVEHDLSIPLEITGMGP